MALDRSVLIAEDDPHLLHALTLRCRELGLKVDTAVNGLVATVRAQKATPDLMIIDIGMPEADGLKVCERLREKKFVLPVIVLTGRSDAETIGRCEALGVQHVLKDDAMWNRLEVLIPRLLESSDSRQADEEALAAPCENNTVPRSMPKVLAVDDDPAISKAIKIRLKYHGVETLEATDGVQGFMIALQKKPDVIITDYKMPDGSGDHLLVRLKQNHITKSIPVIVLTGATFDGRTNMSLQRDVLGRRGASAFLQKPLDFDVLLCELERFIPLAPIKELSSVTA